jgi:Tfp pilus assembly protein PilE
MKKQSGFAGLELLVVVVIVAAIAFVGYYVWQGYSSKTTPVTSSVAAVSPSVTTLPAPKITTVSSLNTAMQVLNSTSVSSNNADSSQLTTQSQGF